MKLNLKKDTDYMDYNLNQLVKLTTYSGVWELKFKNHLFKMINIYNDDFVPLKYFWKDRYEQLSLSLWYDFTRDMNALHFDVGSHTGIYTIIGNLDKTLLSKFSSSNRSPENPTNPPQLVFLLQR